jgi:hypothetical protein
MTTANFGLHFASQAGEHAFQTDTAQIYVKGMYGDGISHPCVNFRELDMEITRLQQELEVLRSKGKKHFTKLQGVA